MINSIILEHQGHRIGKAFNSKNSKSKSVLYCQDCAGEFHGCYCEDLDNCLNCEEVADFQIMWYRMGSLINSWAFSIFTHHTL